MFSIVPVISAVLTVLRSCSAHVMKEMSEVMSHQWLGESLRLFLSTVSVRLSIVSSKHMWFLQSIVVDM